MNVLSLFSGIGGFELAAEIVNYKYNKRIFNTICLVEINPFCQQVLNKNFPNIPIIEDVKDVSIKHIQQLGIEQIDGIVGGFPCQPFSFAGKKQGEDDARFLWGEFARIIRIFQPRWFAFENVKGLLSNGKGGTFKRILWEISQFGYDVRWHTISVSSIGGIHQRERVFLLANNSNYRFKSQYNSIKAEKRISTPYCSPTRLFISRKNWLESQSDLYRSDDGFSTWMDRTGIITQADMFNESNKELNRRQRIRNSILKYACDDSKIKNRNKRLKALGNAICPQVASIVLEKLITDYKLEN
jgi:DNA-cytosine methyltransferase